MAASDWIYVSANIISDDAIGKPPVWQQPNGALHPTTVGQGPGVSDEGPENELARFPVPAHGTCEKGTLTPALHSAVLHAAIATLAPRPEPTA